MTHQEILVRLNQIAEELTRIERQEPAVGSTNAKLHWLRRERQTLLDALPEARRQLPQVPTLS